MLTNLLCFCSKHSNNQSNVLPKVFKTGVSHFHICIPALYGVIFFIKRRKDPDEKKKDDLTHILPTDLAHRVHLSLGASKDKGQTGLKRNKVCHPGILHEDKK